ncbi:MAG: GGDEF domain-containing protein [Erysipelotrichaceae bacterium]|nr:GGDEF domain-containing protein [Erysipelotrichaceae bacterium]MDD3810231.1 GGDEF domain-containing protein [Erysipelotrichaceae bacterium]
MFDKIKEILQKPFHHNKALIKGGADQVARNNLAIINQSGVLGFGITILLCLVTPFLIPEWFVTIGHVLIALNYLFFTILSRYLIKIKVRDVKAIRLLTDSYTFISLILIAYINTIPYPDKPGTLMASMMILSAALFTYSIMEATVIFTAIMGAFVYLTFAFKADVVIGEDLFMVMSGYFLSGVVFLIVNKLRYKEFVLKNHYIMLSSYDDLTGVLAKKSCEDACKEYLDYRTETCCAVIVIDVDNFKSINDSYGHYCGDLVLKTVGDQLQKVFLDTDVIGRIGGDEFLVLMKNINDIEVIYKKLQHFNQVVKEAVFTQLDIPVSLSLGGVTTGYEPVDFTTLYQLADQMMYANKPSQKSITVRSVKELEGQSKSNDGKIFLSCHQVTCDFFKSQLDFECDLVDIFSSPMDFKLPVKDIADIAAVVVDYHQLDDDQYSFLERLKDNRHTKELPVLLVNAGDEIKGDLEKFISHHISYPLTREKLEQYMMHRKNVG